MRTRIPRLVVLLPSALLLPGGALFGQARRPLALEDYFRLESVSAPALSPDGSRVVFVRARIVEEEDRRHSEVWIVPSDGSAPARRLTAPAFSASAPQWSPDGRLLAFASSRPVPGEGRESWWFLRMDGEPGEAFRIRGVEGAPVFSPDGRWIAFTRPVPPGEAGSAPGGGPTGAEPPGASGGFPRPRSDFERRIQERFDGRIYDWMNYRFDRRGYLPDPRDPRATPPRELHVVPVSGGEPRRLTDLGVDVRDPAWSPDGRLLAFTADEYQRDEHTYERADLWVVSVEGELRRLSNDEFHYSSPAWSPDGRFIAVRGYEGLDVVIREKRDRGAPTDLFLFELEGAAPEAGRLTRGAAAGGTDAGPAGNAGRLRNLTADWDLIPGPPTWSPDGRWIYFEAGIRGSAHLFRLSVETGEVEQVTRGERWLGSFTFDRSGCSMAFLSREPTRTGDVVVARVDGTGERRVYGSNEELLAELALAEPVNLRFRSADGTEIEGWLLAPPGAAPPAHAQAPDPATAEPAAPTQDPSKRVASPRTASLRPLVLTIHGGPHGAYGNRFMFESSSPWSW